MIKTSELTDEKQLLLLDNVARSLFAFLGPADWDALPESSEIKKNCREHAEHILWIVLHSLNL